MFARPHGCLPLPPSTELPWNLATQPFVQSRWALSYESALNGELLTTFLRVDEASTCRDHSLTANGAAAAPPLGRFVCSAGSATPVLRLNCTARQTQIDSFVLQITYIIFPFPFLTLVRDRGSFGAGSVNRNVGGLSSCGPARLSKMESCFAFKTILLTQMQCCVHLRRLITIKMASSLPFWTHVVQSGVASKVTHHFGSFTPPRFSQNVILGRFLRHLCKLSSWRMHGKMACPQ